MDSVYKGLPVVSKGAGIQRCIGRSRTHGARAGAGTPEFFTSPLSTPALPLCCLYTPLGQTDTFGVLVCPF